MLDLLKYANLALAFALELAMLAAFASSAASLPAAPWIRWTVAALAVIVAIAIWAIWAAPNSSTRLGEPALTVLKLILFGAAAAGLAISGRLLPAGVFGGLVVLNLVLAAAWDQQ